MRTTPPARARLVQRAADAMKALYEWDQKVDAAAGSPNPELTAIVATLQFALTFARVGITHRQPGTDFEEVIALAREREVEGWAQHRAMCSKCGGH